MAHENTTADLLAELTEFRKKLTEDSRVLDKSYCMVIFKFPYRDRRKFKLERMLCFKIKVKKL